MFWKLLPLIIELVRHGGSVLVERYRARKAAEERMKAEAESQAKVVRESDSQNTSKGK